MKKPLPPDLIDIKAAAAILQVSTVRARQLLDGKPFARRVGYQIVIDRSALIQFATTRKRTSGRPRLS